MSAGYQVEAYLLILAIWNRAYFPRHAKTFNLAGFDGLIQTTEHIFLRLKPHTFPTADFEALREDIEDVYSQFKQLDGIAQTGATKLLHLKHPGLFVMWDTKIRHTFDIPETATPKNYIEFLKTMKTEFGHIKWTGKDTTLAKAVDEYKSERHKRRNPLLPVALVICGCPMPLLMGF
jgi:hypothetical protein